MNALDGGPHGTTETAAAYVEARLHKTPASIHRVLARYLDRDAPHIIGVYISRDWESPEGARSYFHYTASIHIHEPDWEAWLAHARFTLDDVVTTDRTETTNTDSVTRGDGVTIFTIVAKPAEAGELA
ncbi:MAG TPA: hypothetical protein VGL05_19710 [Kribbella sp.]